MAKPNDIAGVAWRPLTTHSDHRGFFRELMRPVGGAPESTVMQISHSRVHAGVVKGWHAHVRQHQWTYVVSGTLWVVLVDGRPDSDTKGVSAEMRIGPETGPVLYGFPPGVLHGYRCLAEADVVYLTSGTYDLSDEIRVPVGDPSVPYDFERLLRAT
ncbi:MAG: dTDP-4-dehydrorhamnose 3,5-epimerase family protein [Phycisphaerae bacterium]|nr:dTDP-4-dehydrorhamnose 3,5-epimerase family protein [Phycisphaerae bacterium]